MGFLSKIIPNELKHGGWLDFAGPVIGAATGMPFLGAAIGGGAAAYRGNNPLVGAGLGYAGGALGNAFSGGEGGFLGDFSGLASTAGGASPGTLSMFGGAGPMFGDISASSFGGFSGGGSSVFTPATAVGGSAGGLGGMSTSMLELLKKLGLGGMVPGGGPLSTAVNLGSALYGLKGAHDLRALGKTAGGFDPQRAGYATQLRDLNANPASIVNRPNFAAGESALINRMKSQGYLGSGNMADAVAKYGSDFFTSESNRLGQLAGAQFAPGAGGNLAVSSMDLASKALASLGYGARSLEEIFGRKAA